jgi:hypothetical protein
MTTDPIGIRIARPDEHGQIAGLYVRAYREFAEALGPDRWRAMQTT